MLIAAILEELGFFDENKEKDKKDEVHDEGSIKERSKNSREVEEKPK
ncbi:MAG: hypothetical protein WBD99_01215 [Thermodesulfobacteriota bacterium]